MAQDQEATPIPRLAALTLTALRAPGGAPVSLEVAQGEAVTLLGADAGTVVAMVAGLLRPQSGGVALAGGARPRPGHGMAALVGPAALLPQHDLGANAALGGQDGAALLAEQGFAAAARFRPGAATPAQALAAALARALASRPALLLLDPDLAALDTPARAGFFASLARLRAARGFAVLHAAARPEDAWALADRVAVLGPMGVRAIGAAPDLYARPPDAATARALGPANLLPGTLGEVAGEEAVVTLAGGSVPAMAHPDLEAGHACLVLVRPEDVAVLPGAVPAGTEALAARVAAVRHHAGWNEVSLTLGGATITAHRLSAAPLPGIGEDCAVAWPAARALVLPAE